MPKKIGRKKMARRPRVAKKSTAGRRRLQPVAAAAAGAYAAYKGGMSVWNRYVARQRRQYRASAAARVNRLENSDNIVTLPAFKRGVAKKPTFTEKVQRINNPPVIYKRNYQWSAECNSGQKGFYGFEINDLRSGKLGGGGLYDDIMTAAIRRLSTDTSTQDPTVIATTSISSQQKVYVDYFSTKLCMINSGTNSVIGKLRLWSYKRDSPATLATTAVPITPINLAMYASTNGGNVTIDGGAEGSLGNYGFDAATAGVNYNASYIMPGSVQNTGGSTMNADLAFELMGVQIKEFVGYFFNLEDTLSFSLKPGQQVNHSVIFNDMPVIHREGLQTVYVKGTSYFVTVEFNAGIVGDSTANNVVSTGNGQLSCMLTEKRVLGLWSRNKTKLVMPTAAPADIAVLNQVVINPDTGATDFGYEEDA